MDIVYASQDIMRIVNKFASFAIIHGLLYYYFINKLNNFIY